MSAEPNLNETDYELLSAYIDEMLTAEERVALETRLKNDPVLRRELNALRQTIALVQGLPTLKAPRNFTLTPEMIGVETPATTTDVSSEPASNRRVIPFPAVSVLSAVASMALVVFGLAILLGGDTDDVASPADQSTVEMTTNSIPQDDFSVAAAPTPGTTAPEAQTNMAESDDVVADEMDDMSADMEMEEAADEPEMAFDADMNEATEDDSPADETGDMPPQAPVDGAPTTDDEVAAEAVPEAGSGSGMDTTRSTPSDRAMPSPSDTPGVNLFSLDMAEAELTEEVGPAAAMIQPTGVTDAILENQQQQSTDVAMAGDDSNNDAASVMDMDEAGAAEPQESLDSGEIDDMPSATLAGLLVIALGVMLGIFAVAFAWAGRNAD